MTPTNYDPKVERWAYTTPSRSEPGVLRRVSMVIGWPGQSDYYNCTCPGFEVRDRCFHVDEWLRLEAALRAQWVGA